MMQRAKEHRAAVRMQAWGRMWIVKARMRLSKAVKLIQRTFRGSYTRRHFIKSLRQNKEDKARRKRAQEEWERLQAEAAAAAAAAAAVDVDEDEAMAIRT